MPHRLLSQLVHVELLTPTLAESVEFAVDVRNQSLEGSLVALPPFEKEPGDLRQVLRNGPF